MAGRVKSGSIFHADRPFTVRKWPGYYGWPILVFGTAGMLAAVPGSPPGMAVFVDDMLQALGLNRPSFALAYSCGTLAAGVLSPWAGRMIDRHGSRQMACLGFILLGGVLVFTGSLETIHSGMRALFGEERAFLSGFLLAFSAFAGIRLLGVGFAITVCRSMVFRWFEGRRGWAASFNGIVLSLAFSSSPLLLNGLVGELGWQRTWITLGGVFAVGMTMIAYVFYRESPEACAVAIERTTGKDGEKTPVPVVAAFTAAEAIRTKTFWIFISGLSLNALIGTGVSFHIVALGENQGLSRSVSVAVFLPSAFFHIATILLLGWLVERIKVKYVLWLMILAQTLSLYGLANLGDPVWRIFFIAGSGVGWGCFGILINTPWPRFYGREHLGAINGWVTGATIVTSALGPYAFGLANGATGSFLPAIVFCLGLCPIVLLLGAVADNPQRRLQSPVRT